jgi:hypothetical protein
MAKRKAATDNGGIACPECKLLLNSGGLMGTLNGILETRKSLNARGKDFSPALYKKLCTAVCGAHKALVALEPSIIAGDNTVEL